MVLVWIPSLLREITNGNSVIELEGQTVGEIINQIDAIYPGFKNRITENNELIPEISVVLDGTVSYRGLKQKIRDSEEIHFLPVLSGG